MSSAIDKIKEGFSELSDDFDDIDVRCSMLESKLRSEQDKKEKFLLDLSSLIDRYRDNSNF